MNVSAKYKTNSLKQSFKVIQNEIVQVEKTLSEVVDGFDPGVAPYVSYVCESEGKRIRPALALLAGGGVSEISEKHVRLGTILELIHIASLVHDDIIDGASERRKLKTAHEKWGEGLAVLLGDALFSHAMSLSAEFDDLYLTRKLSQAAKDVCQGEILQTQRRFDLTLTQKEYFKLIEMKTGALFAAATGLATYISGGREDQILAMHELGLNLGRAYQIYDDCLDMVGTEAQFGKTLGTDLEKGKLTLPLLYLLEEADSVKRAKLEKRILNQKLHDLPVLVGIAEYTGAIAKALDCACECIERCRVQISCIPNQNYATPLGAVCDYLEDLILALRKNER